MRTLLSTLAMFLLPAAAMEAQIIVYGNTTSFSGSAFANAGATSTATGTFVVADGITVASGAGQSITNVVFSVANLDAATFTARPRLRFWAADGPGGGPGTLINGFSFAALSFTANNVTLLNASIIAGQLVIPANGQFWAGILFDGGGGTATVANLNNLGQGVFNPPTVGSSADQYWISTAAGSNLVNNPAGSFATLGGGLVSNFGWQFSIAAAVPEPATVAGGVGAALLAGFTLVRRRRPLSPGA